MGSKVLLGMHTLRALAHNASDILPPNSRAIVTAGVGWLSLDPLELGSVLQALLWLDEYSTYCAQKVGSAIVLWFDCQPPA